MNVTKIVWCMNAIYKNKFLQNIFFLIFSKENVYGFPPISCGTYIYNGNSLYYFLMKLLMIINIEQWNGTFASNMNSAIC